MSQSSKLPAYLATSDKSSHCEWQQCYPLAIDITNVRYITYKHWYYISKYSSADYCRLMQKPELLLYTVILLALSRYICNTPTFMDRDGSFYLHSSQVFMATPILCRSTTEHHAQPALLLVIHCFLMLLIEHVQLGTALTSTLKCHLLCHVRTSSPEGTDTISFDIGVCSRQSNPRVSCKLL